MSKNFQTRKVKEQRALEEQVKAALTKENQQELRNLEKMYSSRVKQIGKGHRDAHRITQVKIIICL